MDIRKGQPSVASWPIGDTPGCRLPDLATEVARKLCASISVGSQFRRESWATGPMSESGRGCVREETSSATHALEHRLTASDYPVPPARLPH
jgi:hypothetical protein